LKRLLDPAVKSPWAWLIDGKVVGTEEARAKAAKTGKLDYDAPIAGLEVVDRYTLRIRLKQPDLRFPVCACGSQHHGSCARGRRSLRHRFRCSSGRNRPLHARRIQAQLEDHPDRESPLS
jgi:hypothetical protein